jgi:hypothetical protein
MYYGEDLSDSFAEDEEFDYEAYFNANDEYYGLCEVVPRVNLERFSEMEQDWLVWAYRLVLNTGQWHYLMFNENFRVLNDIAYLYSFEYVGARVCAESMFAGVPGIVAAYHGLPASLLHDMLTHPFNANDAELRSLAAATRWIYWQRVQTHGVEGAQYDGTSAYTVVIFHLLAKMGYPFPEMHEWQRRYVLAECLWFLQAAPIAIEDVADREARQIAAGLDNCCNWEIDGF